MVARAITPPNLSRWIAIKMPFRQLFLFYNIFYGEEVIWGPVNDRDVGDNMLPYLRVSWS